MGLGLEATLSHMLGKYRRHDVVNTSTDSYDSVNDARYGAVHIGLMKAGYKTMLPSTRNSPEGQKSLITSTGCSTLLHSEGVDGPVQDVRTIAPAMKLLQVPTFDELIRQGQQNGHYVGRYDSSARFETLILHTSGSTGLPKPIALTNGSLAVSGNLNNLSKPQGRISSQDILYGANKPLLVMTPFFHMMGAMMLVRSILCHSPLVLLPPGKLVSSELVLSVIDQTGPYAGIFAPTLLEQIADTPGGLDTLSRIDYVFFGGAPLGSGPGDEISKVTNLVSVIGSTEVGYIASVIPEQREDWQYFEWSPEAGVHMEPEGEGLYEMVIKPKNSKAQAAFHVFPDITEWRTKDLWQQHPSKPGLWRYKGRKDDVIVFSTGEKINPVSFEKAMESLHEVQGAVVFGQDRFQSGLLLEPTSQVLLAYDPSELINELWPAIEKANAELPAHGRVWKSMIIVAKGDKAFKRAPKGSVYRKRTLELYDREIEALYSNENGSEYLGTLAADADTMATKRFLLSAFKLKNIPVPDDAADDADIFAYGVDSLQVLALTSILNNAHGRSTTITARDVYQNSTVKGIVGLLRQGSDASHDGSREDAMADMVKKYTQGLPHRPTDASARQSDVHTVILTGSTGSLGNSILEELISSPSIERVFCLNRSADARARQRSAFESRGAQPDFSKVSFLHTDFSQDQFGLSKKDYRMLLENATLFVHNAWTVDFNKSLPTYEAVHIAGTRRCVDFSLQSKHRAHIVFVSSIASVGNWRALNLDKSSAPEELSEDHRLPLPQGYAESKHVAALILAKAATQSGVSSTVVRCGQLAGPTDRGPEWNKHEWLPSIILTSQALGALPDQLGTQDTIDWVPINLAAKSLFEIAESRVAQIAKGKGPQTAITHIVNPSITSWTSLAPSIKDALDQATGATHRVMPFKSWLEALSTVPKTVEEAEKKPGIKLLDFYQGLMSNAGGLPLLETKETAKLSGTIKSMESIDGSLVTKWIRQWLE